MKKKDNFPKIRTIRYLGNKRKILGEIVTLVNDKLGAGGIVADIFAGTNCVAYALKNDYSVYTNDNQAYSHVISKALIENKNISISKEDATSDLSENYSKNSKSLIEIFNKYLQDERSFFNDNFSYSNYEEYQAFSEEFPYYGSIKNNGHSKDFLLHFSKNKIKDYRHNSLKSPYMLFSTYFLNGYFGIEQCIQIDSLRFAIEQASNEKNQMKKMIYLTALIYALSQSVTSTGHFAQYRNINSEENCGEIIKERKKDISEIFYDTVEELFSSPNYSSNENIAINQDYSELFNEEGDYYSKIKEVDLVYADPPYTVDHYSRYYHVLETLVKYDYPKCERKGRYREDRLSSNFSSARFVEAEFKNLIKSVSKINSDLLLSYTNDGVISSKKLIDLCKNHYKDVSYKSISYNHSNQGRDKKDCNTRKKERKEFLIYCS